MYRIAICDDDKSQVEHLESQLSRFLDGLSLAYEIDCFYTGERLLKTVEDQGAVYQLLLLDIEMQGINGIDLAKTLRGYDEDFLLLYVTSYDRYALESFEVSPFRYLIKPVTDERLTSVLEDVLIELNSKHEYLFYHIGASQFQLRANDIICLYSELGRKIRLELKDGRMTSFYEKISSMEKQLSPLQFVKVNSGTMINMHYISSIRGSDITMTNGKQVGISRGQRDKVKLAYSRFIERHLGL